MGSVIGNLTGGLIGTSDAERAAKEAKKQQEIERRRLEEEKAKALEEQKRIAAENAVKEKELRDKEKTRFGAGATSIGELSTVETVKSGSVLGVDEEEKLGGM